MKIGGRTFEEKGRTYIMGILNITPDSFSDGGSWMNVDAALARVEEMLAEGMDVLDIGGESSRPGSMPVSEEEEIDRVLPVIRAVKARFDVPISLDTCKAGVALAGIDAGVDMLNDISGLKRDAKMAGVIAGSRLPCCLMHSRAEAVYGDLLRDMAADLEASLRMADDAGIAREKIILDPGIGFGKTYEQNLEVIGSLERFHELGRPLLLGASRKSVIGATLDLPERDRLEGTLATTVIGVMKGCMFVRVHDVKENARAVRMTEAVLHAGKKMG